jgi:nitroreductase
MVFFNPNLTPHERTSVPDALELLKIRRSVKPREMSGPGPSASELDTILTIGARVPDHGKLTPWRFIVFEGEARARAGDIIAQVFAKKNPSAPAADIEVEKRRLMDAPLVIAVILKCPTEAPGSSGRCRTRYQGMACLATRPTKRTSTSFLARSRICSIIDCEC